MVMTGFVRVDENYPCGLENAREKFISLCESSNDDILRCVVELSCYFVCDMRVLFMGLVFIERSSSGRALEIIRILASEDKVLYGVCILGARRTVLVSEMELKITLQYLKLEPTHHR